MRAWQKITGELSIEDPKEKELADRFDRNFNELFKVVPKANRRALIDMLYTINGLYIFESYRSFYNGVDKVFNRINQLKKEVV